MLVISRSFIGGEVSSSLSPSNGDLGDGLSVSVVTGLVSEVVDGVKLAFVVTEGVASTDNNDPLQVVLSIQSFPHNTGLLTLGTVLSFIPVRKKKG